MWITLLQQAQQIDDLFIGQKIILAALVLGFLLLAGMCLSARAFTQLLDALARAGYLERRQRQDERRRQTGSSTEGETDKDS